MEITGGWTQMHLGTVAILRSREHQAVEGVEARIHRQLVVILKLVDILNTQVDSLKMLEDIHKIQVASFKMQEVIHKMLVVTPKLDLIVRQMSKVLRRSKTVQVASAQPVWSVLLSLSASREGLGCKREWQITYHVAQTKSAVETLLRQLTHLLVLGHLHPQALSSSKTQEIFSFQKLNALRDISVSATCSVMQQAPWSSLEWS